MTISVRAVPALSVVVALLLALSAPMGAQRASAASAYDDAYQSTDTLSLVTSNYAGYVCPEVDYTNFSMLMADDPKIIWPNKSTAYVDDFQSSYDEAIANGDLVISQEDSYYQSGYLRYIHMAWTTTHNMKLVWSNEGTTVEEITPQNQIYRADFVQRPGYASTSDCSEIFALSGKGSGTTHSNPTNHHLAYITHVTEENIPVDYDGEPIVDGSAASFDYSPKGAFVVEDKRFHGVFICNPSSLSNCPPGYGGVSWKIYSASNELLFNSNDMSAEERVFIDLNFDQYGEYVLKADFYALPPPYIPADDVVIHQLVFPISINGQSYATGTGENYQNCTSEGVCETFQAIVPCVTAELPFVDAGQCIKNVQRFATMLAFKTSSFGNTWSNPNECRTLTVFNQWLHLSNPVVCASVPANIRAVTTPFVTFGLGLITMTFISKRAGHRFE